MTGATFNRLAEQELAEAISYYEDQRPGLGTELLEEVRHAVALLGRHPEAAPRVKGAIRRLVLPRFPYSILYRPVGPGLVRILAVAHHKRHPRYWAGRR